MKQLNLNLRTKLDRPEPGCLKEHHQDRGTVGQNLYIQPLTALVWRFTISSQHWKLTSPVGLSKFGEAGDR